MGGQGYSREDLRIQRDRRGQSLHARPARESPGEVRPRPACLCPSGLPSPSDPTEVSQGCPWSSIGDEGKQARKPFLARGSGCPQVPNPDPYPGHIMGVRRLLPSFLISSSSPRPKGQAGSQCQGLQGQAEQQSSSCAPRDLGKELGGRYSLGRHEHQQFLQVQEARLLPKVGKGGKSHEWGEVHGPLRPKCIQEALTADVSSGRPRGRPSPCCTSPHLHLHPRPQPLP